MKSYLKQEIKNATIAILFPFVVFGLIFALAGIFSLFSKGEPEPHPPIRIESSDSKLMMVAMRCHKMEQDNDMLRLRIDELEDTLDELTNRPPYKAEVKEDIEAPCGQYYLFNAKDDLLD